MASTTEVAVPDGDAPSAESAELRKWREACEPFIVIRQEVEIEVDFQRKSIKGMSTIHLFMNNDDIDEISLDARQCHIDVDNVTVDGVRTRASFSDPYDLLETPERWQIGALQHQLMSKRMKPLTPLERPDVPINKRLSHLLGCVPADGSLKVSLRPPEEFKGEPRRTLIIKTAKKDTQAVEEGGLKISIPFTSKNIRDGLHFVGVDDLDSRYPHVYTRHSIEPGTAACIFPCVDDPGSRHPWKISIKCPRTLGDAFPQPPPPQPTEPLPLNGNRKRKAGEDAPSQSLRHLSLLEEDKVMDMTVVCSGNLTGEQVDPNDETKKTMTFECQSSSAQHISFAIGPFEHVDLWSEFRTEEADEKLGSNAAKIHAYCLPGRVDEVLHSCNPVVAAADHLAPEFGKYPFESYKMVFVEDMVPETVPATSMSLCSTRLLYREDIIDPEIENTRKLVHALACQYLGVHIVPNERSDTWLVVGIQWYMTDLFMKTICGNNWYRFHLKTLSDKLIEADINRPSLHALGKHLHIGDFELEFMALKAPLVLYILDQRMSKIPGSTGIVRVISNLVSGANIRNTDPEATAISTADFKKSCEKKSSYRPEEFWKQWVYSAGCPKFNIRQRFNKKNLNVDITIEQTQGRNDSKVIHKDDFWREFQEDLNHVYAGQVPKLFTGPITIRIHEADGTPYEHYQVIADKDKNGTSFSIAYNTKYKRLKRTKKAQSAAISNVDKHIVQEDDVIYFNMLGDVLASQKDAEDWGLQDWDEEVQKEMDQESYEWIRFDCNFEWLCEIITDMPGYMYLAQLQQDRDVVAHQDAMLFFERGKRHGVAATIETRTVMDRRYYHGIRTMAVNDLAKQANEDLNYIGLAQLIMCFRSCFCYKMVGKSGVTFPPNPNDFSDKAQYAVQCALPGAIARTRKNGRCSKDGRSFLLDLLLFNNNSENEFSDEVYVAKLLEALTTSLIPDKYDGKEALIDTLKLDDDDDLEFRNFIDKTIEEIDKYRRMDEWTSTYQNIWTTTALTCKMRLMKARVIPVSPLEFVQYLQDDNHDLIRIKAFDCLVELNMLSKVPIMRLLLSCMTTDKSPFVRDSLFKIFARGIAAVAFGENKSFQTEPEPVVEVDESGLIIEQGEAEINQRRIDASRAEDITQSLKALKEELKGNVELQTAIWRAFGSPVIGLKEKTQLLEICSAMFEQDDSLLLTFNYPKVWNAKRMSDPRPNSWMPLVMRNPGKSLVMHFKSSFRTEPRVKVKTEIEKEEPPAPTLPPPPPPQEIRPEIRQESGPESRPEPPTKKLKLKTGQTGPSWNWRPSYTGSPTVSSPRPSPTISSPRPASLPTPPPRKDSISVTAPARPTPRVASPAPPAPSADSIAVQSVAVARLSTPLPGTPPPVPKHSSQQSDVTARPAEKRPKPPKKRKSEDLEGSERSDRPKKLARISTNGIRPGANGRPSKVVTVPFRSWKKLPDHIRRVVESENSGRNSASSSTIHATPKRAPGISERDRPSGGSSSQARGRPPVSNRGLLTPQTSREPKEPEGGRTALPSAGGDKIRKPLPGSAPPHGTPSSGPSALQNSSNNANVNGAGVPSTPGTTVGSASGSAAPRRMIKLKVTNNKILGTPSPSQTSQPQ